MDEIRSITDRRERVRVDIKVQGNYQITATAAPQTAQEKNSNWKTCLVVNLADHGLQVAAPVEHGDVQMGDSVFIQFKLGAEYHLAGRVVWVDTIGSLRRFGVVFTHVDETERERLVWELVRLTVKRKRKK